MKRLLDRELEKMQARNQGLTTKDHRCVYQDNGYGLSVCLICKRLVRTDLLNRNTHLKGR